MAVCGRGKGIIGCAPPSQAFLSNHLPAVLLKPTLVVHSVYCCIAMYGQGERIFGLIKDNHHESG